LFDRLPKLTAEDAENAEKRIIHESTRIDTKEEKKTTMEDAENASYVLHSSLIPFILALLIFLSFGMFAYGLYRSGQYAKPGGGLALGFSIFAVLFMLFFMLWLLFGGQLGPGGIGGGLPPHRDLSPLACRPRGQGSRPGKIPCGPPVSAGIIRPTTATRRKLMAKRKNGKPRRAKSKEEQRLQAIYAKSLREFTAADLQKFTVIEKGIPFEKVIAELEKIHRQTKRKRA
jgi:hypothetical protein